jgi:transcriptional regulator GlxA family with amidase domain
VQGPKAVRIEATLHYLRNNFTERLRLRQVARMAGFSPQAFVRIFRETTGTSFLPFVRALRVEFAKDLLATSKMTLEQIADRTGFRTTQNLIRSFRRVTGQAPREFRADDRTQGMTTPGQPKIACSDLFRPLLAMSQ